MQEKLIIHAAEQKFEDKIKESLNFQFFVPVLKANKEDRPDKDYEDDDLYAFSSVLCSSIFNKNDQYFPPSELKAAKKTPINKPINNYHIPNEIVGHMVDTFFLDASMNYLEDDFDESKHTCVHLATHSYLYRYSDSIFSGLSDKVNDIIKSIEDEEMYVSMECTPKSFDYAIKHADGTISTIKRTKENAHLTAKLRYFGGDGLHEGKEIGMCLRGVRFCGKGLVKKPANPNSVIFGYKQYFDENGKKMKSSEENNINKVYESVKEVNDNMEIEKQLEEIKAKLEASEKSVTSLTDEKVKLEQQLAEQNSKIAELTEQVVAAETVNSNLKVEVQKLERTKLLASKGIVADAADKFIADYNAVDDVMFAKVLELQLQASKPVEVSKSDEPIMTATETVNKTPDLNKVEMNTAPVITAAVTEPEKSNPLRDVFGPLSKKK